MLKNKILHFPQLFPFIAYKTLPSYIKQNGKRIEEQKHFLKEKK
jgi:hypothetical protein